MTGTAANAGLKISAVDELLDPAYLPPAIRTLPSCNNVAVWPVPVAAVVPIGFD